MILQLLVIVLVVGAPVALLLWALCHFDAGDE